MRIFKIHENDNVAVAIETIGAGECVVVSGSGSVRTWRSRQDIRWRLRI